METEPADLGEGPMTTYKILAVNASLASAPAWGDFDGNDAQVRSL
jgi:hypothetical protein